ncbi:helix-turn-helix domain-containing protein [Paenibacillus naphthalenovorans]|uniref:helix-turn-helix domain-containing protein n=1 Tax=Paenibacillus naphthalenovorans TaxID=162209 RepID=UPI000AF60FB0|nr:helix-turn-helix transcriptional regulator [Paenibacillus naphthalenovorans]
MDYQKIIKQKGLKQKWIAEKLGVSSAMISMYISGKSGMSSEKIKKLNRLLK